MKINKHTKKIIAKVFKKKISTEKDLNINLSTISDSLKFMELFVEIEKISKKKINPTKLKIIRDINNLF
jgi:acyl carrier protein